eukprot:TRINITY_DN17848_c0_g1_i1.p1 TRINITY_DN17848_c0_g1~~TRINITY_DN17848_c0_g1_i1.p1  ORF type:complete len:393 (-),score=51.57 TRINITY_DN17848_c0_g1_i1:66-1175(-)
MRGLIDIGSDSALALRTADLGFNYMSQAQEEKPMLAAVLVVVAALCFSIMALSVKFAQEDAALTTFTIVAARNFVGLLLNALSMIMTALWKAARRKWKARRGEVDVSLASGYRCLCPANTKVWMWLFVRCAGGFGCLTLEYLAMEKLSLGIAIMIVYSSPAFIVLWALVLLRQPVRLSVFLCLTASMCGLVLIVQPWMQGDGAAPLSAYFAALVSSIMAALAYVALSQLGEVSCHTVLNVFQGSCLVFAVVVGVTFQLFPVPSFGSPACWFLIVCGVSSYVAEVCITIGYACAGSSIGEISVLKLLNPLFSLLWGITFLNERVNSFEIVGSLVILIASAAILRLQSAPSTPKELQEDDMNEKASTVVQV